MPSRSIWSEKEAHLEPGQSGMGHLGKRWRDQGCLSWRGVITTPTFCNLGGGGRCHWGVLLASLESVQHTLSRHTLQTRWQPFWLFSCSNRRRKKRSLCFGGVLQGGERAGLEPSCLDSQILSESWSHLPWSWGLEQISYPLLVHLQNGANCSTFLMSLLLNKWIFY